VSIQGAGSDAFIEQIRRAMDVISRRQQLVAANVGNLDTPGYHAVDLDFDKALQEAVRESVPTVSQALRSREVEGLTVRPDGNNVSLDREMLALAQTKHRYEVSANLVRQRIRLMRYAISEGKAI